MAGENKLRLRLVLAHFYEMTSNKIFLIIRHPGYDTYVANFAILPFQGPPEQTGRLPEIVVIYRKLPEKTDYFSAAVLPNSPRVPPS